MHLVKTAALTLRPSAAESCCCRRRRATVAAALGGPRRRPGEPPRRRRCCRAADPAARARGSLAAGQVRREIGGNQLEVLLLLLGRLDQSLRLSDRILA
jgi:hypothetical protein